MPNEKSAVTDFLNEVSEPKDIFSEKVQQEAVEPEEAIEKEEKPLPFHEDPKVQRYVKKQIEKALKEAHPSATASFKEEMKDIDLPASFVELIGNDTPEKQKVLKDMAAYMASIPQKAKEEFLREQEENVRKQQEQDEQAQAELDDYFDEIEQTFKVDLSSNTSSAKQLRSQFIDYVRKIAPKDENGEVAAFPDLVASFEEFQERNKRTNPAASRAKDLASRGLARSGDASEGIPQGRSWKDVDRFFDRLKANIS